MSLRSAYHYAKAWLRKLFSTQAVSAFLSSFGALWLAVQITRFVWPHTIVFGTTELPDAIRNAWPLFGLVGLAAAAYQCRPRLAISHKLNGRDVAIQIAIGDILTFPGALIIGSNTTFDTRISTELISERSVQGIFTKKYYRGETQLDAELSTSLGSVLGQDLPANRVGKTKKYPMGTCVRLNPKNRTGYLLAIAEINEHGGASGSFNDLKESLPKLWEFISRRGLKEPLVMPVLGTGFSRLPQPREEVIREIIQSFVAACSERTFADKLTIVITPQDMAEHRISLDELGSFLQHMCKYTVLSSGNRQAIGTPV